MAERLAEDLWRLDIPLVGNPLKNLNSYLLTGERSLLIDTASASSPAARPWSASWRRRTWTGTGWTFSAPTSTATTQGWAPELIRPGCRIYIGEIDSPGVKNASDPSCWKRLYGEYARDGFTQAEMEALWGDNPAQTAAPPWREGLYTELQDGAALHYGGRMLRCVLTPGHTPGHLCLYDPARRRLFCGDHVLFHITPNICRWQGVEDSLGDYLSQSGQDGRSGHSGAVSRPPGGDRGPAAADGGAEGPPRPPAGGHPADRGEGAGPHRLSDRRPDALEPPLPGTGRIFPWRRSSLPWERPWPIWTIWRPKGGSSARRYMENGYISPAWATKYE